MTEINGKTLLLGIFGDPVGHSLSPVMQNAALAAAGIDAVYVPFHVKPACLADAVASIRALNLVGVSVTVPHKELIIPYLDELDDGAALIGAVNTVVNREGRLIGYNTDAPGFLTSLQRDLQFDPQGKEVVVLGAGGACRAAVSALAGHGAARIVIANRTEGKAALIAREMSDHFQTTEFVVANLTQSSLKGALSAADLLVNTTSVGLAGESFPGHIVGGLSGRASVYDMVYAASLTPLTQAAREKNLPWADGRGMLVAQGEEAFIRWFGLKPVDGVMHAQVVEK